jgi:hypothetical protein
MAASSIVYNYVPVNALHQYYCLYSVAEPFFFNVYKSSRSMSSIVVVPESLITSCCSFSHLLMTCTAIIVCDVAM